jgi:hypothetical protein
LYFSIKTTNIVEEITRDFANGVKDDFIRRAKLVPWLNNDCTDICTEQSEPNDDYFKVSV